MFKKMLNIKEYMGKLNEEGKRKIIDALKCEPLSVQEISKLIGRSWVTTNTYLEKLSRDTGLVDIKVFRKGSHGALKVAYYKHLVRNNDLVKKGLYSQIKNARVKQDFDFMELYQFVADDKKKTDVDKFQTEFLGHMRTLYSSAKHSIFCFSGNLSYVGLDENGVSVLDIIENALKRKVSVRIIARLNVSTLKNWKKIEYLLKKYEGLFEIRHAYQPLRGFIVDDKVARFKNDECNYDKKELSQDMRFFYEIYDSDWIIWLQDVFWDYYNSALDGVQRVKELGKVFER